MRICLVALVVLFLGAVPGVAGQGGPDPQRGKAFYIERCALCHGESGKGWALEKRTAGPPVPVPDLTDAAFMRQLADEDLFRVIKEGGTRLGQSRFMPPAGRWLSDDEIWDVVAFVRTLVRKGEHGSAEGDDPPRGSGRGSAR